MEITNAKYVNNTYMDEVDHIEATIDGEVWSVPLVEGNRFYNEIMRQVEAGELTIQDAD